MIADLNQVCPGIWGRVMTIDTSKQLRERLQELGLLPGTRVCRRYSSPGRDVAAIEFRGSILALRSQDLSRIRVDV